MTKERMSITIQKKLAQEIHEYAKKKNLSKSQLVENILAEWQKDFKKQQMIEGYKAMADENLSLVSDFSSLSEEAWPDE